MKCLLRRGPLTLVYATCFPPTHCSRTPKYRLVERYQACCGRNLGINRGFENKSVPRPKYQFLGKSCLQGRTENALALSWDILIEDHKSRGKYYGSPAARPPAARKTTFHDTSSCNGDARSNRVSSKRRSQIGPFVTITFPLFRAIFLSEAPREGSCFQLIKLFLRALPIITCARSFASGTNLAKRPCSFRIINLSSFYPAIVLIVLTVPICNNYFSPAVETNRIVLVQLWPN